MMQIHLQWDRQCRLNMWFISKTYSVCHLLSHTKKVKSATFPSTVSLKECVQFWRHNVKNRD